MAMPAMTQLAEVLGAMFGVGVGEVAGGETSTE